MQKLTVQAKTLELALNEAAQKLQTTPDAVGYDIISQTNGGLLGLFGGRKIEIAAWRKRDLAGATARPDQRRSQRERPRSRTEDEDGAGSSAEALPPLTESEMQALIADLSEFCQGICRYLTGTTVGVTAEQEKSRLILNIDSAELAEQFSRNPKLAESMEHLLRKKPRHLKRELPFRIFVDVQGMRLSREQELVGIAQDLSSKVHANKKPIVLNYKSSYDRRVIHMALDQDDRVYTKSIGSGPNRKLMILPVKDSDGGHDLHT